MTGGGTCRAFARKRELRRFCAERAESAKRAMHGRKSASHGLRQRWKGQKLSRFRAKARIPVRLRACMARGVRVLSRHTLSGL